MSLLEIDTLTVRYPGRSGSTTPTTVLDGISLRVDAGQSLGLVGESGSGKSQTALAILGLLPGAATIEGSIRFKGEELLGQPRARLDQLRGSQFAMVFQDPMTCLNPSLNIGLQLAEVPMQHRGISRQQAMKDAARMLDAVHIPNAASRLSSYPHEFSGGMRQRVMIAMALICQPALLVADEPTTALDVTVQAQILDLLDELRRDLSLALLLITHDLGVVAGHCEGLAVMYAGRVVEAGPVDQLLNHPLHPYTQALLTCRPRLDRPRPERLMAIDGQPPDPAHRPEGCSFALRCTQVMSVCREQAPVLLELDSERQLACHLGSSKIL